MNTTSATAKLDTLAAMEGACPAISVSQPEKSSPRTQPMNASVRSSLVASTPWGSRPPSPSSQPPTLLTTPTRPFSSSSSRDWRLSKSIRT